MSLFYGPGSELLYAFYGAATTSTPTVSPGSNILGTYPPIIVPPNYLSNAGSRSSSLLLKLGGQMTATATIPTWQFFLYAVVQTTSAPAFATTNTLGSTGTFTPGAAATGAQWDAVIEIGLRTLALGAASTVTTQGKFKCNAFASAAYATTTTLEVTMPNINVNPTSTFWDTSQAYVLWPALSLGAATAGNTVTVQYAKLYGENN